MKGNYESPQIPFQTSQEISGTVKGVAIRSKPVADSEVLILTKDGDYGLISTDEKGSFMFRDFEYPDSTTYFIQALGKDKSNRVELVLNRELYPKPGPIEQSLIKGIPVIKEEAISESELNAFIVKAEQRSRYDENMRMIHLSEVVVTARRMEKKDEPRFQYWANSSSDVTIRREDFENKNFNFVTDMLRSVPGVRVFPDGTIEIRGIGSINSETLPLVLIDGMPYEWKPSSRFDDSDDSDDSSIISRYDSPLEQVRVHDVESIDIFKGASSAVFGVRGGNGVISISTRKGANVMSENNALNFTIYSPIGYQQPVEFYSPKYETSESAHSMIPDYRTTIFWKPDIVISDAGEADFEFYTSDFSTTYSVVIEGLTQDGRIIRQVEKMQVK